MVELLQVRKSITQSTGNVIQILFHFRSETKIDQFRKIGLQQLVHRKGGKCRDQL